MNVFLNNKNEISEALFKSAITSSNSDEQIIKWLSKKRENVTVKITQTKFSQLDNWSFKSGHKLVHKTGRFFTIEGIHATLNSKSYSQPIINQPEIGILGIIAKQINGVMFFLLQAKIEPGNLNVVQLSPTVQATKSNYTSVHGGTVPRYLDYFISNTKQILFDQLQSEQGARFFKKRNRNIIIYLNKDIDIHEDYCWLTLADISLLMGHPNVVNMDTRTVLSMIDDVPLSRVLSSRSSLIPSKSLNFNFIADLEDHIPINSLEQIQSWFTEVKCNTVFSTRLVSLSELDDWLIDDYSIQRRDEEYFKVIPITVEISNREVTNWSQPMILPMNEGICGFLLKEIRGVYHFLVQAKTEIGNFDIVELGPTIQSGIHNNFKSDSPRYFSLFENAPENRVVFDVMQSEEGGRFYREQNRNIIIIADENFPIEVDPGFIWITLPQLKYLVKFSNVVNIQARSLIAAISFP